MSKPPKIVIPGLNRGIGVPPGYVLGRMPGTGQGPAQLLNLSSLRKLGVAGASGVAQSTSTAVSIAHSETVSLKTSVSTSLSQISSSLSGAVSSTGSLSTAVSTVISGSISAVNSRVDSLSTAVGGGGGVDDDSALSTSLSSAVSVNTTQSTSLSQISSSLSGAISSTSSLSSAVSTVDSNQSTSLSQISSSLSAEISTDLSRINSLSTAVGGGGGGGGTVSLVQSKAVVGDTVLNSITLGASPTAGNMLILLGTHWTTALTVAQGWNTILNTSGSADGEICLWKLVNNTDAGSATIAPFTGGASGQMGVVFEVSGALAVTSGAFEHFKETTATSQTLNAVASKAGSLLVGYFGTISSNTAPTSVTNVTSLTTVTGTTTNASPRQITPFYNAFGAAGSLASVCTYAASHSQYGAAYVCLPA